MITLFLYPSRIFYLFNSLSKTELNYLNKRFFPGRHTNAGGGPTFIRSMLSRATLNSGKIVNSIDAKELAKAALGFTKMLTNPELSFDFIVSAKTHEATFPIVNAMSNYITDDNYGTSTIKVNIAASLESQNKQMNYPINALSKLPSTSEKIAYHEKLLLLGGVMPIRALVEKPIIENFAKKYNQIKKIELLGDQLPIINRKDNPNRDFLVTFSNDIQKDMDVKTKNFDDDFTKGNLRQIDVVDNTIVTYPRDYSTLNNQYQKLLNFISDQMKFKRYDLTPNQSLAIGQEINIIYDRLYSGKKNILEIHNDVDQALMNINILAGSSINFSFNNIYYLQKDTLTQDELNFLQEAIQAVNPLILSKSSYMNAYLVTCLKIYQNKVNPETYKNLKPFFKVYPFVKRLLEEYGSIDHYV